MNRLKSMLKTIRPIDRLASAASTGIAYNRIYKTRFDPEITIDCTDFNIGEIEININCNLDCLMCNSSTSTRPRKTMSLDLFERCVIYEKQYGLGSTALHTIGEPLLNPLLADYLRILRRNHVTVFLSTNALLLADKMELLFEYSDVIASLRFSIDGATKATYEKIRRHGSFERLCENLDAFTNENRKRNYIKNVQIHSIVSNDVKDELAFHLKFYSDYVDMRRIYLSLLSGLSPDNRYFMANSVLPEYIEPWRPCEQLFQPTLHVLNDGSVTMCCRDYHGDLIFGHLDDGDLRVLLNNDIIRNWRKQHLEGTIPEQSLCGDCFRIAPVVSGLFSLFVERLVARHHMHWDVDSMQGRFDLFFACFRQGIPSRRKFVDLVG